MYFLSLFFYWAFSLLWRILTPDVFRSVKIAEVSSSQGALGIGTRCYCPVPHLTAGAVPHGKGRCSFRKEVSHQSPWAFLVAAFFPNTAFTSPGCSVRTLPRGRAVPARPQGRGEEHSLAPCWSGPLQSRGFPDSFLPFPLKRMVIPSSDLTFWDTP